MVKLFQQSDVIMMDLKYPGVAIPNDMIRYGIENEVPFRASWNVLPRLADIDGDGKLDLLRFGAFGRDEIFINQGTKKKPQYDHFHTICPIPLEGYYTDIIYGIGPMPNTQRVAIDVFDWDGDGGQDLIINGWYRFEVYLDRGRNEKPRWEERPVLVCTPQGVLSIGPQAVPRMVDWDGDGKIDLLFTAHPATDDLNPKLNAGAGGHPDIKGCIHGIRSEFYLCRNIGTREEPLFDEPELLKYNDKPFGDFFKGFASFEVCDWNGDGKLDLLIGSGDDGHVYFVANIGTQAKPNFAAPVAIEADGQIITTENYTSPAVGDWNGDGKPDLIVGVRAGYVYLFENISNTSAELPKLRAAGKVTTPARAAARTPIGPGVYVGQFVADWDEDGVEDLIAGDETGHITFFRNVGKKGDWKFDTGKQFKTTDGKYLLLTDLALNNNKVTPGNKRFAQYGYTSPTIIDLNGDGHPDMVVSTQLSELWVLYNAGMQAGNPCVHPPQQLMVGGKPYLCPCRVRPGLADFDGDGIPDMIHLDLEFNLTFHKGVYDGKNYSLKPSRYLKDTNGQLIQLRPNFKNRLEKLLPCWNKRDETTWNCTPRAQFQVVDWDGDGKLDLLISTVDWASIYLDCEILFLRNVGTNPEPVFEINKLLIDGKPFIKPDSDHDCCGTAVCWGGHNGLLDLTVGTTDGWIYIYDGKRFSR